MKLFLVLLVVAAGALADVSHLGYNYEPPAYPMELPGLIKDEFQCPPPPPPPACPAPLPPPPCPVCKPIPPPPPPCPACLECPPPSVEYLPPQPCEPTNEYLPPARRFLKKLKRFY